MTIQYKIKSWENYQHYKDRNPPWIKLHYETITSRDWVSFDDASKLLAVVCMMLASRNNGMVDADVSYIQKVAHLQKVPNLKPLIESGFLVLSSGSLADASTLLADAIIEERRGETEKIQEDASKVLAKFEDFWKGYPSRKQSNGNLTKGSRKVAEKTWKFLTEEQRMRAINQSIIYGKQTDARFVKDAHRWLYNAEYSTEQHGEPAKKVQGKDYI